MIRVLKIAIGVTLLAGIAALVWPAALGGTVSYLVVSGESMEPAYRSDDVVIVRERTSYGVGDVVAYRVPDGEAGAGSIVIHRVTRVGVDGTFATMGDNRTSEDYWRPTADDVVGTPWVHIPRGGRVLRQLQDPMLLAAAASGIAVWLTLAGRETREMRLARRLRPGP